MHTRRTRLRSRHRVDPCIRVVTVKLDYIRSVGDTRLQNLARVDTLERQRYALARYAEIMGSKVGIQLGMGDWIFRRMPLMNRAEAMQKAIKLLRLATSDNPHEAALAAQRAQEILDRFEITQAMLEDSQTRPEPEEEIENFEEKQAPLDQFGMQIEHWKSYLSSVIATANACCVFSQRKEYIGFVRQRSFLHIVGRPTDVEKVRYLYGYLVGETDRLCRRRGKGCGRTWMNQFRLGVVDTLAQRLREGHEALIATMRKEAREQVRENPRALVVLEKAIAKVDRRREDTEVWVAQHLNLGTRPGHRVNSNLAARVQGRIAGQEIHLTRARGAIT